MRRNRAVASATIGTGGSLRGPRAGPDRFPWWRSGAGRGGGAAGAVGLGDGRFRVRQGGGDLRGVDLDDGAADAFLAVEGALFQAAGDTYPAVLGLTSPVS